MPQPPNAAVEAAIDCVYANTTQFEVDGVNLSDASSAAVSGNYEQKYHVRVSEKGQTRNSGYIVIDVYRQNGEWKADHVKNVV